MPGSDGKITACIDFDGVINDYQGWKGVDVFEHPVPGAAEALSYLRDKLGWYIIIHTTRVASEALESWLCRHDISYDTINQMKPGAQDNPHNAGKPPADIYIDDRGFRFNGNWPETIKKLVLMDLRPWGKKTFGKGFGKVEHYNKTDLQPVDVIESWQLNWNLSNVIKYVGRRGDKGDEIGDLEKALDYLQREIATLKAQQAFAPVNQKINFVDLVTERINSK